MNCKTCGKNLCNTTSKNDTSELFLTCFRCNNTLIEENCGEDILIVYLFYIVAIIVMYPIYRFIKKLKEIFSCGIIK